jgi:hypothetical protein
MAESSTLNTGMRDDSSDNNAQLSNVGYQAKTTLMRYLQDLPYADKPSTQTTNNPVSSKSSNGKPKLVLMGQRRYVADLFKT